MRVEAIFKFVIPNMTFHVSHINIWKSDEIYRSKTTLSSHLDAGISYWDTNKSCIERDVVSIMSGRNYGVAGYTASNGIRSICGGTVTDACFSQPYHATKFNGDIGMNGVLNSAHRVAHELVHNFGSESHICSCNGYLMFGGGVGSSSCPLLSCPFQGDTWDSVSYNYIATRFSDSVGYQLCNFDNNNLEHDPNICLTTLSTSNGGGQSGMLLTIIPEKEFYCKGNILEAFWFDQTNTSNNFITWQYGPFLSEFGTQPHNKRRKLQVSNSVPPNLKETWIKVTFNHPSCTNQAITYVHKIILNATFSMTGTYVSIQVPTTTIAEYINVIPAGTYTIRMATPANSTHTWEELQPDGITYLPLSQWPSNTMDFTMPVYPSTGLYKTFRVTVPNSCGSGNFVRTLYFAKNANPWGLVRSGNGNVFPNPSNGLFKINCRDISSF
jgi:Metallo-peptidase family M12B Reprolysin-like